MKFYVDLPNPYDLEGPWITVAEFDYEEELQEFLEEKFGTPDGRIQIVSTFEDD